jgi:antitoxin (DNA-binding transcriptional repressor) of toxin-antitoxin stability system
MMRTIGIRELKAQLSKILRDVQAGDTYLVTDRGRVVAEMRRPDAAQWSVSPQERALARLASSGHLRIAEPQPNPYQLSPLKSLRGVARDLIDDDRSDR